MSQAIRSRLGTAAKIPAEETLQVLGLFGFSSILSEGAVDMLRDIASAQDCFGGKTFVALAKVFIELPELFKEFRAALALEASTWALQQILLTGMFPQNLLEKETP